MRGGLDKKGTVYSSIIEEVINSSRIDFEEAGINVSTLEDLKQVSGSSGSAAVRSFPHVGGRGGLWAAVVGCVAFWTLLALPLALMTLSGSAFKWSWGAGLLYSAWVYDESQEGRIGFFFSTLITLLPFSAQFALFFFLFPVAWLLNAVHG